MTTGSPPSSIRVNGVDLAYVTQGTGQPVVFVHGSVNDYRAWGRQFGPFTMRYRVVAYSRRYHWPNEPPRPGDAFSAAQQAADLGALIEALALTPAHLVGSSYGALTSLTLAVDRPELVRALVLGEPPLLPWLARTAEGAAVQEAFLAGAFRPAGEALARGDPEGGIRTFIDGVIGPGAFDRLPPPAQDMMLANAAVERLETATPPERYFPNITPAEVTRLPMPVLLVEGARSPRMFGLITDALAAALPTAERIVIPEASHGMHGQNPTAYTAAVLGFLARHDRTTVP
jgi:non-heme chloroperoxidase